MQKSILLLLTLCLCSVANADLRTPDDVESLIDKKLEASRLLLEQQHFSQALDQLQQTRHWVHQNLGVRAHYQIPVLDLMTTTYRSLGDMHMANHAQEFAFFVVEKNADGDDNYLLDGYQKLGDHYLLIGEFQRAVGIYKMALKRIDKEALDPARQVGFLLSIGRARLQSGRGLNDGIKALTRAQDIVDPESHLAAVTELGLADLYCVAGEIQKSTHHYRAVWHLLSAETDYRDSLFSKPSLLFPVRFSTPFLFDNDKQLIQMEFEVDEYGKTTAIKFSDDVHSLQRKQITHWMQRSVYRPRFEAGEPVTTPLLTVTGLFGQVR